MPVSWPDTFAVIMLPLGDPDDALFLLMGQRTKTGFQVKTKSNLTLFTSIIPIPGLILPNKNENFSYTVLKPLLLTLLKMMG